MKLKRGSTSVRRLIFVADSSSTTGAGLASLAHNASGLVGYYFAGDLNNEAQITLASATLGSFTSGGWVAVDNTNMPGWYEVGIPDAALDGGNEVAIQYRGATNMVPVNIYIELDAVDYQTDAFGALKPTTAGRTLDVSTGGEAGIDFANIGSPTTTINLSGTTIKTATDVETDTQDIQSRLPSALVSGRMDSSVGAMAANVITATSIAADAITDAKVAADVTIASVTGSVGSVTGAVGSVTGNVGGNVVGSVASVTAQVTANVTSISGDSTAADNCEAFFDGTGYAGTNNVIPTVTSVTNRVTANTDQWNGTGVTTATVRADLINIAGAAVSTSTAQLGVNVVNAAGTAWGSGAITANSIATGAITNAKFAAGAIDAAAMNVDGSEFTAIPWNAAWDTEVQSEVQDAIEANHLDHLLAVTYDPASKPGVSDALLNELVENDGGVARFTANALEQGPSGGGGVADWTSDERTAIRAILGIPGSGTTPTDPTTGIMDTIRDLVVAVDTVVDNIEVDTQDIQSRLPVNATTEQTISSNNVSVKYGSIVNTSAGQEALIISGNRVAVEANLLRAEGAAVEITGNHVSVVANQLYSEGYDAIVVNATNSVTTVTASYIYGGSDGVSVEGSGNQLTVTAKTLVGDYVINNEASNSVINVEADYIKVLSGGFYDASGSGVCNVSAKYINSSQAISCDTNNTLRIFDAVIDAAITISAGTVELFNCICLGAVTQSSSGVIRYDSKTQFRSTTTGSLTPIVTASATFAATTFATNAIDNNALAASAAAEIADAVWDEPFADHTTNTTFGFRIDAAITTRASQTSLDAVDDFVDTEVAAIKAVTDKLDTALELDGAVYRYTANALEEGPSGGGAVADWTSDERTAIRAILGIPGSGTTPADPTTGILDTIRDLVVTVDSVADAIEVDTQDIQSRLPSALVSGRIDASVGAMAANTLTASALATDAVDEIVNAVFAYQVTQDQFEILLQNMSAGVSAIETDTQDIQSRLPSALVSGRINASVGAMAADTITASALAADAVAEIAGSVWDVNRSQHATNGSTGEAITIVMDLNTRIPDTLAGGLMKSSVQGMAANTLTASALASDAAAEIADAVWDEAYSQHTTAGTFGKLMDTLRKSNTVIDGTVTSAVTATTTSFSSGVNYPTGAFKHAVLLFLSGPLAEQNSPILTYTNTNGVITVEEAFTQAPGTGNEFIIIPTTHVHAITAIQAGLATSTGVTNAFTEIKGAGWSSSTDTLEKIRDAAGTGGGGGGGTIIQTPIIGIVPERDSQTLLRVYRGETVEQEVHVFEGDGETPIDLSGKTLEIVFEAYLTEDVVVISNANIDVSGDDNNVVTFDYPSTLTATTGKRFWSLREATSPYTVYLNGEVHILRAAVEDPSP